MNKNNVEIEEQRRKHGIPDSDQRPFKIALNEVNKNRRINLINYLREEENKNNETVDQNSNWVNLGKSIGFNDSDISDANNSVDNNEYDYLPGSYQSITMNSNLVNRLPSNNYTNLYQPVSSTQQFNDNDNYVLDNDELDKYDWSYDNINNNNNDLRLRKRTNDEISTTDDDIIDFRNVDKRRRASSITSSIIDNNKEDDSYDEYDEDNFSNYESERSTTPQNEESRRGLKRNFDEEEDIINEKRFKPNQEWTDLSGTTYKIDEEGIKRKLTIVKETRTKFSMPKDSKHPDRDLKVQVLVEKWLTDEEYDEAFKDNKLGWQPDDQSNDTDDNDDDEIMSEVSLNSTNLNKLKNNNRSSSVYYKTRTPIKRALSVNSNTSSVISSSNNSPQSNNNLHIPTNNGRIRIKTTPEIKSSKRIKKKDNDDDIIDEDKKKEAKMLNDIRNRI